MCFHLLFIHWSENSSSLSMKGGDRYLLAHSVDLQPKWEHEVWIFSCVEFQRKPLYNLQTLTKDSMNNQFRLIQ